MKHVICAFGIVTLLGVLTATVLAGNGSSKYIKAAYIQNANHRMASNIVQVNYGHHYGPHGRYYGGWSGPRVVYAPGAFYRPVIRYPSVSGYFPYHPSLFPPPCYYGGYYYPRGSFYYASPGISVGIGF
jgi:hypothetical protein